MQNILKLSPVTFTLAHIHKTIHCVHKTSKSSEMEQHSVVCYAQNQHLPCLSLFRLATRRQQWKFYTDKNGTKAIEQYYRTWLSYYLKNVSCYQTPLQQKLF